MIEQISFELVLPEQVLFSGEAEMVTLPGSDGDFGVLSGHEPLIALLRPGVIEVKGNAQSQERYFSFGGFAEILPEKITVLMEAGFSLTNIDAAFVDQKISEARRQLSELQAEPEHARASATFDALSDLCRTV